MKLIDYIRPYFQNNDKLKALFFFDADRGHEREMEELKGIDEDILIKVCKKDWFTQKVWLQENEDVSIKVLYYPGMKRPESQDEQEEFGLMGELLANEELQIDDAAVIVQELKLNVSMKYLVIKYLSELKRTGVRSCLKELFINDEVSEQDLQRGILGVILNAKTVEDWTSVMMRLVDFSLDEYAADWSKRYIRIQGANLVDVLNDKVRVYFGTVLNTGSHDELKELALRVKYNLITNGLDVNDSDPYGDYKIMDASVLLNLEQVRKSLYNKSKVAASFIEAMQENGVNVKESKIVECYGYGETFSHYNDALRFCLLSKILNDFLNLHKDVKDGLLILKKQTPEENVFKGYVEFLLCAVRLSELVEACGSFNFDNNPTAFVEKYIGFGTNKEHYSMMDFLYRKALYYFYKRGALDAGSDVGFDYVELDEGFSMLKRNVEARYLSVVYDLNASWMRCLKAYDFDYSRIKKQAVKGFNLQYDFFNDNVAKETCKVAVIVSDGLRYEVAEELVEMMKKRKGNVQNELGWCLASVPSTTLFGMANLLPCVSGKYLGKSGIELDGVSTNGMANRAKILEASQMSTGKVTRAVAAQDVLKNNVKDNREIFKANIVYVYHDEIDSASHATGKEDHAIGGSQIAVEDLSKLVTKIIGSNVTKIIITADHGFLYRDSKIDEKDKICWTGVSDSVSGGFAVEQGARHAVVSKHIPDLEQAYAFDLKNTTRYKEDFQVHTPVSTNRLKGRGVTYTYTHGGASLQELVVPVVTISCLTQKETHKQQKVGVQLIGDRLSVRSNVLKDINILQVKSISTYDLKRIISVGLYDGKELVSDVKSLVFNMTGKNPSERMLTVSLTLQKQTSASLLRLRAYDVDDDLNALFDVSVKNNTLVQRDFDL